MSKYKKFDTQLDLKIKSVGSLIDLLYDLNVITAGSRAKAETGVWAMLVRGLKRKVIVKEVQNAKA